MRIPFLSQIVQTVGIDLGSSQTRIWTNTDGIVLEEPTCIAIDATTKKVLAAGDEAKAMEGRVGKQIIVSWPVQNGSLYDLDVARALLRVFLRKVLKSSSFIRPIMMVSVPAASTDLDRAAINELFYSVGARQVYTISQPLAAAIGSGVPIADASGSFILHMGSGRVEAAIISLGSLIAHESTPVAGSAADATIKVAIREAASLTISLETAEKLKKKIGSISGLPQRELLVTGQDVVGFSPKEVRINSTQLQPALHLLATRYERMLKHMFARIPPELTADVIDKGMLLSGGFGQVGGLDSYLVNQLGIPVSVVENPAQSVIKGIGTALEHVELFKESLGYQQ
jgi:rod shape-determining protein MreB